jgi:hypothetical protein
MKPFEACNIYIWKKIPVFERFRGGARIRSAPSLRGGNDGRILELQTLCDPRVRMTMKKSGVELRSFRDFAGGAGNR